MLDGRPRMLDLFCGAGGAGVGYRRAGWDVFGGDLKPQPSYPMPFRQGDAIRALQTLLAGGWLRFVDQATGEPTHLYLSDFAAIHASPPCQGYTMLKAVHGNEHPLMIDETRELLEQTGLPYVIENVQGSPLRRDMVLCGEMFGLGVIRHRYFELGGWTGQAPEHVRHSGRIGDGYVGVHGRGGGKGTVDDWRRAMGIDWMPVRREVAQAIPPAYTELIGGQLLAHHERRKAA